MSLKPKGLSSNDANPKKIKIPYKQAKGICLYHERLWFRFVCWWVSSFVGFVLVYSGH